MHLVAVTNTGVRLYFTTSASPESVGRQSRLRTLDLLHVRLPPPVGLASPPTTYSAGPSSPNPMFPSTPVGTAFTRTPGPVPLVDGASPSSVSAQSAALQSGVTLVSVTQPLAGLLVWAPTVRDGHWRELHAAVPLAGVWAMAEEPPDVRQAAPLPPAITRHPWAAQPWRPPRSLVALTPQGVTLVQLRRPVDQLAALLRHSQGESESQWVSRQPLSHSPQRFFERYGADEACAMSLLLACAPPAGDATVAAAATRTFFKVLSVDSG